MNSGLAPPLCSDYGSHRVEFRGPIVQVIHVDRALMPVADFLARRLDGSHAMLAHVGERHGRDLAAVTIIGPALKFHGDGPCPCSSMLIEELQPARPDRSNMSLELGGLASCPLGRTRS